MSKPSKFANEPLMYIQQTTPNKPNAPMQHFYTTPKKSRKPTEPAVEAEKKTKKPTIKRRPSINSYLGEATLDKETKEIEPKKLQEVTQTTNSTKEELKESKDTKKKFKEMTIQEKIDYLMNTSSHLPRMRCEVITEERKYRGSILADTGDQIRIRVGNRSTLINKEDITEIQLIGF